MPTPNTVLMTTAVTAMVTLSFNAWTVSGSVRIVRRSVRPSANVFFATSATGQATSITRYPATISRKTYVSGPRRVRTVAVRSATAHHPALDDVEDHDDGERDDEQHDGDRGCSFQVVVLDAAENAHRRDLRAHRQVAGEQHQRAVLADAPGEGQGRAGGD